MEPTSNIRPLPINLYSSPVSSPTVNSPMPLHQQLTSPFRYIQFDQGADEKKSTPLAEFNAQPSPGPSSRQHNPSPVSILDHPNHNVRFASQSDDPYTAGTLSAQKLSPSLFLREPSPFAVPNRTPVELGSTGIYTRPRGLRIWNLVRPWIPLILYAITTIGFIVAIGFYRDDVFSRLDELSHWLQSDLYYGYATLFLLIFLTTFPPVPLYSTLITLSGYTYGAWTGAVISYAAALSGALTVFIISRTFFVETISGWLTATRTIQRVVWAVERRPKLLFLIRLAPYPYNVMNCLLAAAPRLTLKTYTLCTGLSLFKVIIHTSMGASLSNLRERDATAEMWSLVGIGMCIGILIYISIVARKAVDNEIQQDEMTSCHHNSSSIVQSNL